MAYPPGSPPTALQRLRLLLALLVMGLFAFGLVFWAGLRGLDDDPLTGDDPLSGSTPTGSVPLRPTPLRPTPPDQPYAAVEPALIPALLGQGQPPDPLNMLIAGLPPLGSYLPASGDTQFTLPQPTITAVVPPLPSATPYVLPVATPASLGIIPTTTPTPYTPPGYLEGPPPEDYAGEDCAPSGWPVATARFTQYYHWYHPALDFGIPLGSPVMATHSATVKFAGWRTDGYGNLIILENGRFITYYAHLTDFNVVEGQQVGKGSVIGWSGSTGYSTGPHVHYEIRIDDVEVDPLTFEQRGHPSC